MFSLLSIYIYTPNAFNILSSYSKKHYAKHCKKIKQDKKARREKIKELKQVREISEEKSQRRKKWREAKASYRKRKIAENSLCNGEDDQRETQKPQSRKKLRMEEAKPQSSFQSRMAKSRAIKSTIETMLNILSYQIALSQFPPEGPKQ